MRVALPTLVLLLACAASPPAAPPAPVDPCTPDRPPTVGDACTINVCASGAEAMVCIKGRYARKPCRGTAGCKGCGAKLDCDLGSAILENEPCVAEDDNYECTVDKHSLGRCLGGQWKIVDTCSGPKACSSTSKEATCDSTIAVLGDICEDADTHACTSDKSRLLVCKGGQWDVDAPCRGPNGCRKGADKMMCDMRIAKTGDPCDDDEAACSLDGRQMLECSKHRMVVTKQCAKKGCTIENSDIKCD